MHDIRLAIRSLRSTPVVSLVAVLSLALGIGANTAIFSLVDSLVLRAGVAVGAGVSVWASKFVATLLFGLEPRDPATFVGAALLLLVIGFAAGWLPARRAAELDPVKVLREN